MNHYVYEITNLINGKKYIGKRSCKCNIEDDKYMGSGKYLIRAFKKYGVDNFEKRIIEIFEKECDAYEFERMLIQKLNADISDKYYNIAMGGKGGVAGCNVSEETRRKISEKSNGRKMPISARIKLSTSLKNSKLVMKNIEALTILKHKKVICLNNLMVFDSVVSANEYMGFPRNSANISRCCKLNKKSAGKINGKRAIWMFYDEYLNASNDDFIKILKYSELKDRSGENSHMYNKTGDKHNGSKKVIRLNDFKIFANAVEAYKDVGLSGPSKINACCRGERKSAGKINGEKVTWKYYKDYLKEKCNENKQLEDI